jgi:hypothetical protein
VGQSRIKSEVKPEVSGSGRRQDRLPLSSLRPRIDCIRPFLHHVTPAIGILGLVIDTA